MFKMLVLISLLQLSSSDFGAASPKVSADCPGASNLQKTGETGNSFTCSWVAAYSGAQYRVWYVRHDDGYNSGQTYTYSTSHNFTGLAAGHYTFYVQTICEGEVSSFIGIEDTICA